MTNYKKIILAIALVLWGGAIAAQTPPAAKLSGVVIDNAGEEPLVGATVYIEEIKRGAATDRNGEFFITGLSGGTYTAKVSFLGYHTHTEKITLRAGETKKIIIRLDAEARSLAEVVVTAKSEARQLREQAMPVTVIDMRQMQGTVSNVQDILSKTMGVTIRSSGGVGSASRLSVRGLEGKRIGFFIDETPLNDHSDFIDINDIPVEMIERIEIYKGVVPAKFGGSAVGGAVNLVIKDYPPRYFDINYTVESFNTHKANGVFKRNIAEKGIELGMGGFYTYSDNDYVMKSPFQDNLTIKRNHDRFEKFAVAGGLTARKWYFDKIKFEPVYMRTKKQIQGIQYNIQEAQSHSDAFILESHLEKHNFLTEGLDLDASAAYAYTIFHFTDTAKQRYHWDMTPYPAVSIYGGEIGTSPSLAKNLKHTVIQQLNLNYVVNKYHTFNFNSLFNFANSIPSDAIKDKAIGYRTNFDSRMISWVAGLGYEYKSADAKLLNATTLKYYHYSMDTKIVDLYGSKVIEDVRLNKNNWGINDALRYKFTSELLAKASCGYEVRLPSENELIGDGFLLAASGGLRPERGTNINLGLLYDKGHTGALFSVEVNAFYSYLKDMIRYTKGPLQAKYENFGEMRSLGVEGEVKADLTPWLYGYVNATYQDLRDTRTFEPGSQVPNPSKGLRMPNIPYFLANAGIELHKENLFGGTGQNTRLFIDNSFIEEYFYDFKQSYYQDKVIPRTYKCDVGLEHSISNGRFIVNLKVNNLTNARLLSEFNYPLPGRTFGCRLRYIFK